MHYLYLNNFTCVKSDLDNLVITFEGEMAHISTNSFDKKVTYEIVYYFLIIICLFFLIINAK